MGIVTLAHDSTPPVSRGCHYQSTRLSYYLQLTSWLLNHSLCSLSSLTALPCFNLCLPFWMLDCFYQLLSVCIFNKQSACFSWVWFTTHVQKVHNLHNWFKTIKKCKVRGLIYQAWIHMFLRNMSLTIEKYNSDHEEFPSYMLSKVICIIIGLITDFCVHHKVQTGDTDEIESKIV